MKNRVAGRVDFALYKVFIAFIFWFFEDLTLRMKVLTS